MTPIEAPPAEPDATAQIEAVLRAPEIRAAAALDAEQARLATLQARGEAVRRRLQAQQAEPGAGLNALAHRDYTKLHVLLGGALAMELREAVESTRAVFEGRSRAGGKVIDPSVYETLDRVARLIRQVTPADIHRCPPGRPGCGCLIAQVRPSSRMRKRYRRRSPRGWRGSTTWKRGSSPRLRPAAWTGSRRWRPRS